jgi:prepilin-type processing-associated H-X9-DG protein
MAAYKLTLQNSDPHGSNVGPGGQNLLTYSPFWNGALNVNMKSYVCPSDATNGPTWWTSGLNSYAYNAQAFPVYWNGYNRYPASISDGTSNSIFFTELRSACSGFWPDWGTSISDASWPQPTGANAMFLLQPAPTNNCPFSSTQNNVAVSPHTGGINVGLGDGSVRFVSSAVSPGTWWSALTVNQGEVLNSDW